MDYLINWRNSVWVSMREKEDNCWKFIAVYVPAVLAVLGIGFQYFPLSVLVLVSLIATIWGVLTVIDANFWFNRNLKIVANIENFVAPYIYEEHLIPSGYAEPHFTYLMTYRTMIRFFNIVFLGVLLWWAYRSQECCFLYRTWAAIFMGSVALCLWVLLEDRKRRNEYAIFFSGATGSRHVDDSAERLEQAKKAIRKFDTDGPIIIFVATGLQMVSILVFFEIYCPGAKGTLFYTILLGWPFAALFVYPLLSIRVKLKGKEIRALIQGLLYFLHLVFVILLTVIAVSASLIIIILKCTC